MSVYLQSNLPLSDRRKNIMCKWAVLGQMNLRCRPAFVPRVRHDCIYIHIDHVNVKQIYTYEDFSAS